MSTLNNKEFEKLVVDVMSDQYLSSSFENPYFIRAG
jgi:hypothetical protein